MTPAIRPKVRTVFFMRSSWCVQMVVPRTKTTTGDSRLRCSRGLVNKTDDDSDDRPLEEISNSLSQSEFQPDVQVHVVVQHKSANHENADESAEARTCRSTRSARMQHGKNNGDNQDRHESCGQSDRHDCHHFFLGSEYVRVLMGFIDKSRHQPEH